MVAVDCLDGEWQEDGATERGALVLLSGGLDSATVLAIAQARSGRPCYALSFDYGQRSAAELEAARRVASRYPLTGHKFVRLGLDALGGSALTDHSIDVPETLSSGIPITYVPARNTIFLSYALAWAEVLRIEEVFIGINAVDYAGYPDCRPEYLSAFERLACLATRAGTEGQSMIRIQAPLLYSSKAEIIRRGIDLGVDYAMTVSCYQADATGLACRRCAACRLRAEGFHSAGVPDPTRYF